MSLVRLQTGSAADVAVLRKEWDDLAKQNPERLNVKYVLDKKSRAWNGQCSAAHLYKIHR